MKEKQTASSEIVRAMEESSMKLERVRDLITLTSDYLESEDISPCAKSYDTLMLCALDYVLEVIEHLDSFVPEKPQAA